MKQVIQAYFDRLSKRLHAVGRERAEAFYNNNIQSYVLNSALDKDGCSQWLPAEKLQPTSFSSLELKYNIRIHQDIQDYYNQYWFYEIFGKYCIDDNLKSDIVELNPVLPGEELQDLERNIQQYYWLEGMQNIRMIPIGMIQQNLIVVDNNTGEIYLDHRYESGKRYKIAKNLACLISCLRV